MNRPVKVAIAGLGNRGFDAYARCAALFPELMRVTAVADISPEKVKTAAAKFDLPRDMCFDSAEEMTARKGLADVVFICTPDRFHAAPAVAALKNGYHLLLEKPVAPTPEQCREVLTAAESSGRTAAVCHVLRYTPFFQKLKSIVDEGAIGDIVTIQAIENVGYYHQAHSFVRGNWRNAALSSSMILQKCCHDMDILLWLTGKRAKKASAFGGLYLFREEKAPEGSAERCLDGCGVKDACPFDAEKIYITDKLTGVANGKTGWPNSVLTADPTVASVTAALKDGPYGRCVYRCDNDVPDHMTVNIEFDGGVTAGFIMSGLTSRQYRRMKLMGTAGDIEADMDKNIITVTPFGGESEVVDINALAKDLWGHSGGDHRMVREFLTLIRDGQGKGGSLTSLDVSIESHFLCFAAERSRLSGGAPVSVSDLSVL